MILFWVIVVCLSGMLVVSVLGLSVLDFVRLVMKVSVLLLVLLLKLIWFLLL